MPVPYRSTPRVDGKKKKQRYSSYVLGQVLALDSIKTPIMEISRKTNIPESSVRTIVSRRDKIEAEERAKAEAIAEGRPLPKRPSPNKKAIVGELAETLVAAYRAGEVTTMTGLREKYCPHICVNTVRNFFNAYKKEEATRARQAQRQGQAAAAAANAGTATVTSASEPASEPASEEGRM